MRPDLLSLDKERRSELSAAMPRPRKAHVQIPVPGLDEIAPKKGTATVPLWVNGVRKFWVPDANDADNPR